MPATVDRRARTGARPCPPTPPTSCNAVTARMLAGDGDLLPVSALPVDGTFPTGTARWEKRAIAARDPDLGSRHLHRLRQVRDRLPARRHPHEGVRARRRWPARRDGFLSKPSGPKDLPDHLLTIQVAPDDCTGCGVCVDVCPAQGKTEVEHKAINMEPAAEHRDVERRQLRLLPGRSRELDRDRCCRTTRSRARRCSQPLFEFSGACAGCGETPYLKLLTQLFGDRMIVANATGCSSIYGGNLPTTPWTRERRGSRAGLVQLAVRGQRRVRPGAAPRARRRRTSGPRCCSPSCAPTVGDDLVDAPARRADQDDRGRRGRAARSG